MLQLEPSGAETQVEPAAAYLIERRGHLRGETRVAIGVAIDQRADTRTLGVLTKRAQYRPTFHARGGRVGYENRIKVIECPQRVISPTIGLTSKAAHLFPFDILLSGLHSKANRVFVHTIFSLLALDCVVVVRCWLLIPRATVAFRRTYAD